MHYNFIVWNVTWPQPKHVKLPISSTWITEAENENVSEALSDNWIGSNGKFNVSAEKKLTDLIGGESLLVANGSVALILALKALGIKLGDEVIVPNLTYAATASSVIHVGAEPVFADVSEESWGVTLESIKEVTNENTKCIILVYLYGVPFESREIKEFAKARGIAIIADCAEAFLAKERGVQAGLDSADVCTFSFFSNKLLTCGEGGAVSTKNPTILEKMLSLRGQGMAADKRYYFIEPGFNFRLSNLHAAILDAQITRYSEIKEKRYSVEQKYSEIFRTNDIEISSQEVTAKTFERSPWLFTTRIMNINMRTKLKIADNLARIGVETRPVFYPLTEMPAFANYRYQNKENAHAISINGLSFPTGHHVSENDITMIAQEIKRTLNDKN